MLEEDGKILACGGYAVENNVGYLCWYIVHPTHHGKGLGGAIVTKSMNALKAIPGVSKIIVRTSQLVYPFYENFGFRLISTQDHYWGNDMHMYYMETDV